MLIYNSNNIYIDINLEIVPCILTFTINDQEYRYTLGGDNLDNCPYDTKIKEWFENNNKCLTEIVWEWNLNKSEFSKLDTPLII